MYHIALQANFFSHPTPRRQRWTAPPTIAFSGRSHVQRQVDYHANLLDAVAPSMPDSLCGHQPSAIGGRVSKQAYIVYRAPLHYDSVGPGSEVAPAVACKSTCTGDGE